MVLKNIFEQYLLSQNVNKGVILCTAF